MTPSRRDDETVRIPPDPPPPERKVLANKLRALAADIERGEANETAVALLLQLIVGR